MKNCISCGRESLTLYSETSYLSLPIFCCNNCHLFVTGSTEEEVKEYSEKLYDKEYWDQRGSVIAIESNFSDPESRSKQAQLKSQLTFCQSHLDRKSSILEIGSGSGQTLIWFESMGFIVRGIEPDIRNVELINTKLKNGKCLSGYAEDLQIDGKFDAIWLSHVFEHLVRPDLLLEKISAYLNENGFIFIEVPDCQYASVLRSSIYDNPSTYHFSRQNLVSISRRIRYRVEKCESLRRLKLIEKIIDRNTKRIAKLLRSNSEGFYTYSPYITTHKNGEGEIIRLILSKGT